MGAKHYGLKGIEADAKAMGFEKVTEYTGAERPRVSWQLKCSICGEARKFPFRGDCPPEYMAKGLRREGWTVGEGKKPRCGGACGRSFKLKNDEPKQVGARLFTYQPVITSASLAAMQEETTMDTPNEVDFETEMAIGSKLMEAFDRVNGLYHYGQSDKKVAEHCKTTVMSIEAVRKKLKMTIREDPLITQFRDDLEMVRLEFGDEISKLSQEMSALSGGMAGAKRRIEEFAANEVAFRERFELKLKRITERLDEIASSYSGPAKPNIKIVK
jgi:hypothetical protein